MKSHRLLSRIVLVLLPMPLLAAPKVTVGTGATPAELAGTVAAFRTDIARGGTANTTSGPFANGFRNINWDGAPDGVSAPNAMPADFFNSNVRRGARFTTPTDGAVLQMSADTDNPTGTPVRFGHIDPSYPDRFKAFTEQRLFAVVGGVTIDTTFFVPSSPATTATVNGMGVVFCDVDLPNTSALEFFDAAGNSLGRYYAPVADNGFSFVGVFFPDGERVALVRITQGNLPLSPVAVESTAFDAVVLDDVMFGEPLPLGTDATFVNVANRARIAGSHDVSITGFVIGGTAPKAVLVRVAGPALAAFGVTDALANPQLALMSQGQVIGTNDDWGNRPEIQQAWVKNGAFPFAADSGDAALIIVLNPGAYSVIASGVNNASGVALTEIYEVR